MEQNGFVAIQESNLRLEEDGEGWETVCYSKKTKTPEKCAECNDITHDYGGEPRVKRLVTANGDLQPIRTGLIPKIDGSLVNPVNGLDSDHSKPLTPGDGNLVDEREILAENAGQSISPMMQKSLEENELADINDDRYHYLMYFPDSSHFARVLCTDIDVGIVYAMPLWEILSFYYVNYIILISSQLDQRLVLGKEW